MIISGIKRIDRIRGSGWLDCAHCGEHSMHDVVDDMRFGAAPGLMRYAPIACYRRIACRRCGFATPSPLRPPRSIDWAESMLCNVALGAIVPGVFSLAGGLGPFAFECLAVAAVFMGIAALLERRLAAARPAAMVALPLASLGFLAVAVIQLTPQITFGGIVAGILFAASVPAAIIGITQLRSPETAEYLNAPTPEATIDYSTMNTAGQPIKRAWMVPIGAIGLILAYLLCLGVVGVSSSSGGPSAYTYVPHDGGTVAPLLRLDLPSSFSLTTTGVSSAPSACQDAAGTGYPCLFDLISGSTNQSIVVDRDTLHTTLASLILAHFGDQDSSLNTTGAPLTPPPGTCTTVAGITAYTDVYNYTINGQTARSILYVFSHDNVGYVVWFNQQGGDLSQLTAIANRVIGSIKFATGSETGAAMPTPSPSSTPVPTSPPAKGKHPTAPPAPSPSPSASAGPTPPAGSCLTRP